MLTSYMGYAGQDPPDPKIDEEDVRTPEWDAEMELTEADYE